ncbi:MAG: type II toxin-antitoxin system VapC family toxin [Gemmatimonadales bacterium]|nr:type II toxin-antitoxin system VapC family toxin [Gemmatimonadales bacterium]
MILYVESSAVLAWLLGEPAGEDARAAMERATRVVTSAITAVECARSLARARADGRIEPAEALAALRLLDVAAGNWDVHDLSDQVLARARTRFPVEPVRTLDALHLATVAAFHEALGPLAVLSHDDRVRANAAALGLELVPSGNR